MPVLSHAFKLGWKPTSSSPPIALVVPPGKSRLRRYRPFDLRIGLGVSPVRAPVYSLLASIERALLQCALIVASEAWPRRSRATPIRPGSRIAIVVAAQCWKRCGLTDCPKATRVRSVITRAIALAVSERPFVTNDAYRRLMALANENRQKGETVEQAFARLYADPSYRELVSMEKRMHTARVAKAVGVA
jgi:hypothetical protein